MAIMNLNWTPAPASNPNYTNQRAKAIAKPNGLNPDRLLGFIPQNLMGKTISSATYTTDYVNIIYRFMVETVCSNTTLPNTNGVQEQIVFRCLQTMPKSVEIIDNFTYTMQLLRNGYSQLDGGQIFSSPVLSIDSVEVSLTDINGTVVKGPFTATQTTTTGNTEIYEHVFTGLTPGTSYIPRSVLIATILINGVPTQVRSDSPQYLGAVCLHNTVTTTGTTSTCSIYDIDNQGVTSADYTYTPCTSTIPMTSTLPGSGRFAVCAENGSVSATGNVVITQGASCGTISGGGWSVTNNRTTAEFQNFDFAINNTQITNGNTSSVSPNNSITGTSTLIPVNGTNVTFTLSNTMINAVKLNGLTPLTTSGPAGTGAPITYGWTNVTANQLNFTIVGN